MDSLSAMLAPHGRRQAVVVFLGGLLLGGCQGGGFIVEDPPCSRLNFHLKSLPPAPRLPDLPPRALERTPQVPAKAKLPAFLPEGPNVLPVTVRHRRHEREEQWLIWVEERQLQGWGQVEKLPEGAFRLGTWWIERHGRQVTRAWRYPEEPAEVCRRLQELGHTRPDQRLVRLHAESGRDLNREIEWWVAGHHLLLEDAVLRTKRNQIGLLRQLVAGYFAAFAQAASTMALAQGVGGTPEEVQAQSKRRGGLRGPPRGPSSVEEEGGTDGQRQRYPEPKEGRFYTEEEMAEYTAHDPRLRALVRDPSQGHRVDAKRLREAEVGLGMVDQGRIPGPLRRDPSGNAEFFDGAGVKWDVKGYHSGEKKGFQIKKIPGQIQEELDEGENVIVDTAEMTPEDIARLRAEVKARGWGDGRVVFFPEP